MKLCLVVAVAKDNVIGNAGDLPWHLPNDLKHFKAITMGHPMLMGRKTYQSIGKPLPGRLSLVVSRDTTFNAPGVHVFPTIDAAIGGAGAFAPMMGKDTIMVIGGGQIYAQTIDQADRIELTEIDATCEGDTLFPAIDRDAFVETNRTEIAATANQPAHAFVTLVRNRT